MKSSMELSATKIQRKSPTDLAKVQPHGLTTTDGKQITQPLPSPVETDKALRQSLKLVKNCWTASHDNQGRISEMTVTGEIPENILTMAESSLMPIDNVVLVAMISSMYVETARPKGEQIDLELAITVYFDRLSKYPADIVHDALASWPEQSKWWPTWKDLFDLMDWRYRQRVIIRNALLNPQQKAIEQKAPERESQQSKIDTVERIMGGMKT